MGKVQRLEKQKEEGKGVGGWAQSAKEKLLKS